MMNCIWTVIEKCPPPPSPPSLENSQSPVGEAGGSHDHMSPEEHYRRMMSALSEQGSYEEQQQRLYQLASSMGLPGHGQSAGSVLMFVLLGYHYPYYDVVHCTFLSAQLIFFFSLNCALLVRIYS